MSTAAERQRIPFSDLEQLRAAREVILHEADSLAALAHRLDGEFCRATRLLARCRGSVIVTGMGKAGLIGRKVAATFSSTGTRAHFLHPAEAVHGDLGCLNAGDVLLAFSNSGETEELCRILPVVRRLEVRIVAVTSRRECTLACQADATVPLGRLTEAGPHGLIPSTSTTAMLAVGDALALVLCRLRGLTPQEFALYHPAGSLGQQLKTVGEVMRSAEELRIAPETATIRDVFVRLGKPGRRSGAVMLLDDAGRLSGLFTDSDLARLLEQRRESQLDRQIGEVMTPEPLTIGPDALLRDAVELLSTNKVSELPVIDNEGRPIGLIDITDVIGLMPGEMAD